MQVATELTGSKYVALAGQGEHRLRLEEHVRQRQFGDSGRESD